MTIEKAIQQKSFQSPYHKLVINISYTHAYITGWMHKELKPYNISPEQFNVMRILRGVHPKGATILSITDRMINKMSNASRLVEKLRLKGLVERSVSSDDRRKVDVVITGKGMEILKNLDIKMMDIHQQLAHLSVDEVNEANAFLDKLRYPNE
jgi:DNA-binding MarR family transcriptional regulator